MGRWRGCWFALWWLLSSGCGVRPAPTATKSVFERLDFQLLTAAAVAKDPQAGAMGALMVVLPDPDEQGKTFALPFCSGVQIGPRQVLTAAHCSRPGLIFNKSRLAVPSDTGKFAMERFGQSFRAYYSGALIDEAAAADKAAPLQAAAYQNPGLDFAVLAFPYDLPGPFISLSSAASTVAGAALQLYAYPNGMPLTYAAGCTATTDEDGRFMRHDCDSLTGSSGGLLADQQGHALAIQLAGPGSNRPDYYDAHGSYESAAEYAARRGCTAASASDYAQCLTRLGLNRGLQLAAIRAALVAAAPAELLADLGLKAVGDRSF